SEFAPADSTVPLIVASARFNEAAWAERLVARFEASLSTAAAGDSGRWPVGGGRCESAPP
ncbi:unnamed protein product, partial [Polarella glacialis]